MATMRSQRHEKGWIYVISASNGYVKIGSSRNSPFERYSMVACHSPLPVTLSYLCECSHPVDVEEAVHRILTDHRCHREWFDVQTSCAIDAIRATLASRGFTAVGIEGRRQGEIGTRIQHRAGLTERAL